MDQTIQCSSSSTVVEEIQEVWACGAYHDRTSYSSSARWMDSYSRRWVQTDYCNSWEFVVTEAVDGQAFAWTCGIDICAIRDAKYPSCSDLEVTVDALLPFSVWDDLNFEVTSERDATVIVNSTVYIDGLAMTSTDVTTSWDMSLVVDITNDIGEVDAVCLYNTKIQVQDSENADPEEPTTNTVPPVNSSVWSSSSNRSSFEDSREPPNFYNPADLEEPTIMPGSDGELVVIPPVSDSDSVIRTNSTSDTNQTNAIQSWRTEWLECCYDSPDHTVALEFDDLDDIQMQTIQDVNIQCLFAGNDNGGRNFFPYRDLTLGQLTKIIAKMFGTDVPTNIDRIAKDSEVMRSATYAQYVPAGMIPAELLNTLPWGQDMPVTRTTAFNAFNIWLQSFGVPWFDADVVFSTMDGAEIIYRMEFVNVVNIIQKILISSSSLPQCRWNVLWDGNGTEFVMTP